jgi:hypothetical protein
MRFEVPQFIDVEDKIFGPFTWRQFVYLGGGVGMGVVLFLTTPFLVFVLIGLPLAGIALALAFYPINNRPFHYFLEAVFNYFTRSKLYLWKRKENIVYKARADEAPTASDLALTVNSPRVPTTSVTSLARRLELQALQKK